MRRGTRVGQAYVAITADGDGINEEIVKSVDEAGPGVEKAGDEHGDQYGEHFSEGFFARMRRRFGKDISNRLNDDMGKAGKDSGDRFGDSLVTALKSRLAGADAEVKRLLSTKVDTNDKDRFASLTADLRTAGKEASRLRSELSLVDRLVSGNGRERKRTGLTAIDDWLRGTRSRNNFINFFAQALGGAIHGIEGLALAGGRLFKTFKTGFSEVEEGSSLFQKLLGGFSGGEGLGGVGAGFKGIAMSAPAASAGIAAVVVGMSLMVSIASALLAIITALVATIVSALVGALAVAGGAILAVVAAGGLLVAAFMSMTDAQQKMLKVAFLPIKEEMVGIAQIMLRDLVPAFAIWSKNIQQALLLLAPLASLMGKAFANAGTIFTAALSGPGFQQFAAALGTYLPGIVMNLSAALGSFLNGMLSLFAAVMPYVAQFSQYLANVAARFASWAASANGQNSIVDFVGRALESLKSLWDFIAALGGFIAEILFSPQAQSAGNSIFESLANTFRNFTAIVARAAANGDLKKWFDDAIKFGGQLWGVIEALGGTFIALYNSGVLDAVGKALGIFAHVVDVTNTVLGPMINLLGKVLPSAMAVTLGPLNATANAIIAIGKAIQWALGLVGLSGGGGVGGGHVNGTGTDAPLGVAGLQAAAEQQASQMPKFPSFDLNALIGSGTSALNATSISSGGFKPKAKFHNPWIKWANSLIKQGPSISAQIRNAMLSVNKAAASGIRSAAMASDAGGVQSAMQSLVSSIQTTGEQTVNSAQQALNNAATSLANATSKGAMKRALKKVRQSQKDLKAALNDQKRINAAAKILNGQQIVRGWNVNALLSGVIRSNTTLAEFAEARSRIADMLNDANQKLTEAIQLRDNYKEQVANSIKEFGSLLTAQASVINGVEQALTATDITANLQDRLTKIKKFQDDLRLLLAQGLSNAAYQQIVDAGVEQGTQIADALLQGGNSAIQNTNSLVDQINNIADTLGTETSDRMYQAGVDAAQGLVDGLTSLSAQLDAAAVALGNSIAAAVKRALGIKSPSRVLRSMMGDVGDGAVLGLDDQQIKVSAAAARLASAVAIRPDSTYSSTPGDAGVSGNGTDPRFRDLVVQTPTEDPKAVALEVLNEVTGRLP